MWPIGVVPHLVTMARFPYFASPSYWVCAALGRACTCVRRPSAAASTLEAESLGNFFLKRDMDSVFPLSTPEGSRLLLFRLATSDLFICQEGSVNGKVLFELLTYIFFLYFIHLPFLVQGAMTAHVSSFQGSLISLFSGFSPRNLKPLF